MATGMAVSEFRSKYSSSNVQYKNVSISLGQCNNLLALSLKTRSSRREPHSNSGGTSKLLCVKSRSWSFVMAVSTAGHRRRQLCAASRVVNVGARRPSSAGSAAGRRRGRPPRGVLLGRRGAKSPRRRRRRQMSPGQTRRVPSVRPNGRAS